MIKLVNRITYLVNRISSGLIRLIKLVNRITYLVNRISSGLIRLIKSVNRFTYLVNPFPNLMKRISAEVKASLTVGIGACCGVRPRVGAIAGCLYA